MRDRFVDVWSKLLRIGMSANHSGGSSSAQRWLMTGGSPALHHFSRLL